MAIAPIPSRGEVWSFVHDKREYRLMAKPTFTTNPVSLVAILQSCDSGKLQLPDFQRSWVWEEDRILSLIASISRSFPIGALMTLASKPGGEEVFARREIKGAPNQSRNMFPDHLLLDGQQRMTSMYQACFRKNVVELITTHKRLAKRWFYIDIKKCLRADADRDDAVFVVPEDRIIKKNFDKDVVLDLSKPEFEYENFMYPLNQVFNWDAWQEAFGDYWIAKGDFSKRNEFNQFKNHVLQNFNSYHVPVISLDHETTHEAVCLVFEKVNTGGKALDAFELLTAMYAARGHKLRDDWLGEPGDHENGLQWKLATFGHAHSQKTGVLEKVASTDFLQAIALLHTKQVRYEQAAKGVQQGDLPAVRATRQSLLDLPLDAYRKYRDVVEAGFKKVVKFLHQQQVFRVLDLPYQAQLVPLAAIFAELGNRSEHASVLSKITRWYWCGVLGELYGSGGESRYARDILEVPIWLDGGPEPSSVHDGVFRAERLDSMRTRQSAAYKGIHALLMREGAKDFRTGQGFDVTVFFDEAVDIHHIFPEKWCKENNILVREYDTVVNKTPLSFRTNRIIGGIAPSKYIAKIEAGRKSANGQVEDPPIDRATLDAHLISHCIPVGPLRADDFKGFMQERRAALLKLISAATGHAISKETTNDGGIDLPDELERDSDTPSQ